MRTFVNGPGTLFIIAENSTFNIAQDTVNALMLGIGSSMRLEGSQIGTGFLTTTNIAPEPLMSGVGSITYNFTNSISGGIPLARTASSPNAPVFIAFESFAPVPEPTSGCCAHLQQCPSCFDVVEKKLRVRRVENTLIHSDPDG